MKGNALAGRSFLATFGLVFLAIAGLFVADTFLAKTDREESHIEAARHFAEGQALMKRGENLKAIDRINDAIAIERTNRDYLQALAEAEYAAGKYSDADATLTGILNTDSTDGPTNLWKARVLIKEGHVTEAVAYFHRAIYGHWPQNADQNRRNARLELIDLLAQQNSKEELLAELLPVSEHSPQDVNTRSHLGELFLQAGSPQRAAEIFRKIVRDSPSDASAYLGLGKADFAQGEYRAAQRDFQTATRITPSDSTGRHWLDLCDQVLQLDPTLRGLGSEERLRRSRELVGLAQQDLDQCQKREPTPDLKEQLDKADAALKAKVKTSQESEVAEADLDLAEQLWQARKKECLSPQPTESPLALVLARLAR